MAVRIMASLVALVLLTPRSATAADNCPSERSEATAGVNMGDCLTDARAAKREQPELAAKYYRKALGYARKAYDATRTLGGKSWLDNARDLIYWGTEGCEDTSEAEMLAACVDLLAIHVEDLARARQPTAEPGDRLEALKSRLAALTPAASATPEPEQPALAESRPEPAPGSPAPAPRRSPRGSYAALGTGLAVTVGSSVLLGVSLARYAAVRERAEAHLGGQMDDVGTSVCKVDPPFGSCDALHGWRAASIAGMALLGAGLATTAVAGALVARHRRAALPSMSWQATPLRGGFFSGLTLRF